MKPQHQRQLRRLVPALAVGAVAGVVALCAVAALNGEPAVATVAGALLVFAGGEVFTRRRTAQQYRWDKIAPCYIQFVVLVRELSAAKVGTPEFNKISQKSPKVIGDFGDHLMLWGTPRVIKAWVAVQRLTPAQRQSHEMIRAYARVLLAIRQELGNSDWTLDPHDLLRITIEDADNLEGI